MTAPKLVRGLEPHCAKGMWAAYASLEWVLQTERSVRRPTSWCGTKETNAEMKEGQQEARELSASNYGCNEWWLLLEPTAEPSAKRLRR